MSKTEQTLAKAVAELEEVTVMAKARVAAYTRKDGTMVKEHDDGRVAAAPNAGGVQKIKEGLLGQGFRFHSSSKHGGGVEHHHFTHPDGHAITVTNSGGKVDTESHKSGLPLWATKGKDRPAKKPDAGGEKADNTKIDLGAGSWRLGHKVKLHAPGHKLHGMSGEIVGKGHKEGHVNVSSDKGVHSIHGSELRPADGHHWPDHETFEQRKK